VWCILFYVEGLFIYTLMLSMPSHTLYSFCAHFDVFILVMGRSRAISFILNKYLIWLDFHMSLIEWFVNVVLTTHAQHPIGSLQETEKISSALKSLGLRYSFIPWQPHMQSVLETQIISSPFKSFVLLSCDVTTILDTEMSYCNNSQPSIQTSV